MTSNRFKCKTPDRHIHIQITSTQTSALSPPSRPRPVTDNVAMHSKPIIQQRSRHRLHATTPNLQFSVCLESSNGSSCNTTQISMRQNCQDFPSSYLTQSRLLPHAYPPKIHILQISYDAMAARSVDKRVHKQITNLYINEKSTVFLMSFQRSMKEVKAPCIHIGMNVRSCKVKTSACYSPLFNQMSLTLHLSLCLVFNNCI